MVSEDLAFLQEHTLSYDKGNYQSPYPRLRTTYYGFIWWPMFMYIGHCSSYEFHTRGFSFGTLSCRRNHGANKLGT